MPLEPRPPVDAVPRRLFYWCHTTARQPFETGIQRVTRRLGRALERLGTEVVPVGRDERSGLIEVIGHGHVAFEALLAAAAERTLFIPELTADLVARGADPAAMGRAYGMRTVSFVHDLIPLKLRDHYSAEALAMFTAYFESFARTDAVLATTRGVAEELRVFLSERALRVPPVTVVPLPAQFGDHPRVMAAMAAPAAGESLKLAALVSWERRKNLLGLLRALARAQAAAPITLTLVGRRGLDPGYDTEVDAQLATASGVTVAGSVTDAEAAAIIAASHATVYPSWEEGFGLPIGESLWLGRPCLCHDGSSMAETAPGGGTLMVDMTDEAALAAALVSLATQPAALTGLGAEAVARPLTSWLDYAGAVGASLSA